jgi:glutamine synthetase
MIEADDLISQYESEGINRVKLGFTDIDGVLRGKYISLDKFKSIAAGTAGFCDCVLGWDMEDQLYDNAKYTGWHTAFPDAAYRLDLTTERRLQDENRLPFFLIELVADDGGLHPICPRSRLQHILGVAESMGYLPRLAFEYEFFIFNETSESVREKNYTMTLSDLFNEFMDYCLAHDFPLEGLHCETGPGVWEAAITVDDALAAADKAVLFKTFAKAFFQKRGMIATFMAKWSMDYPGQSGHVHQSLLSKEDGRNVFFDTNEPHSMSATMRHYVGGLRRHMKPLLAVTSPTINSYTRLVKGAWAPTAATWAVENRTAALRVIEGSDKSQRVEFRVGSADANPYLVAAANLAAGLTGISEEQDPGEAVVGNAYELQDKLPEHYQLCGNLRDANREFVNSKVATRMFGSTFVDHYAASRDWEVREYERAVNDWQLRRYFEII